MPDMADAISCFPRRAKCHGLMLGTGDLLLPSAVMLCIPLALRTRYSEQSKIEVSDVYGRLRKEIITRPSIVTVRDVSNVLIETPIESMGSIRFSV